MATMIETPQVITFVNTRTRPCADAVVSAIRTMQECIAEYSADGIGPLVAGTQTLQQEFVDDGSATDGRTPLLGYDVDNFNNQLVSLLNFINGQAGMLAALTKPSVNSQPKF